MIKQKALLWRSFINVIPQIHYIKSIRSSQLWQSARFWIESVQAVLPATTSTNQGGLFEDNFQMVTRRYSFHQLHALVQGYWDIWPSYDRVACCKLKILLQHLRLADQSGVAINLSSHCERFIDTGRICGSRAYDKPDTNTQDWPVAISKEALHVEQNQKKVLDVTELSSCCLIWLSCCSSRDWRALSR